MVIITRSQVIFEEFQQATFLTSRKIIHIHSELYNIYNFLISYTFFFVAYSMDKDVCSHILNMRTFYYYYFSDFLCWDIKKKYL